MGYENPTFAVLEADYEGDRSRVLTQYVLDMGLNHIVRKSSHPVNPAAHKLCSVPGGSDGPSGVVVCSPGQITWTSCPPDERTPVREVTVAFPTRDGAMGDSMVVAWAAHRHRSKFFLLLQVEEGDVFKLTLTVDTAAAGGGSVVTKASLLYFDTLVPSSALCVLRNGFLFCAGGDSRLYQFAAMGDDADVTTHSDGNNSVTTLVPRPLKNLVLRTVLPSLGPLTCSICADVLTQGQGAPQLWAGAGVGESGSLVELKRGLAARVLASQQLPGVPESLWTMQPVGGPAMLVLSFANATLCLGVSPQGAVSELAEADSQIVAGGTSLLVAQLGSGDLVQATPHVLRHVRGGGRGVAVWNPPPKQRLIHAAAAGNQVLVALSSGELVYFELDPAAGVLLELERLDTGSATTVTALALAPPAVEGGRSKWAAFADAEQRLRILSLQPDKLLQRAALQQLPQAAHSIAIVHLGPQGLQGSAFVCVGTRSGLLLRSQLDSSSGALADTRSRFLGLRPVRLAPVRCATGGALLALGERPWLLFSSVSSAVASSSSSLSLVTSPVACAALQHAASFASAADPFGWAALQGDSLKVLSVTPTAEPFHLRSLPLHATPRKLALHVSTGLLVAGCFSSSASSSGVVSAEPSSLEPFGMAPVAASLHLVDPFGEQSTGSLALSAALRGGEISCMTCAPLAGGRAEFLVVGLRCPGGRGRLLLLSVARAAQGAPRLVLEQSTDTAEVPTALATCHGMLLAGMGRIVRLYDVGKKQLLKKCENHNFPHQIVALTVYGTRFLAADSREGVMWCFYEAAKNAIRIFADEVTQRHMSAMAGIDYNTAAAADKFGTVSIVRLGDEVNEALRQDAGGAELWQEQLQGAPWKSEEVARVRLTSLVTSLHCASLAGPASGAVVVATTIHGSVVALAPILSREEVDFLTRLEALMRIRSPPLLGASHLRARSSVLGPVLRVLDGDLCEGKKGKKKKKLFKKFLIYFKVFLVFLLLFNVRLLLILAEKLLMCSASLKICAKQFFSELKRKKKTVEEKCIF